MPYDIAGIIHGGGTLGGGTQGDGTFASGIMRAATMLDTLARRIEPDFIRLGESLQHILDKVDSLHKDVSAAITVIAPADGGGILGRIDTYERALAARFKRNTELLQGCLERTRASIGRLGELAQTSTAFHGNSARMNTIGIYFSIEISRSADASRVFTTFAEDIRDIFNEINGLVDAIRTETGKGLVAQTSILRILEGDYQRVAEDSRSIVGEGYETIQRVSRISVEMLERITGYFTTLERNIGRILTALQIGDIARQQIEHIVAGLNDIPLGDERTSGTDDGKAARSAIRFKAASLQLAQLRHVRVEIGEANATIRDATEQIAVVLEVLAKDVEELTSGVRNRTGVTHWADEMTEELRHIMAIDRAGKDITDRTFATMNQTAEASLHLRRHVESIGGTNRRLRFEAYNARILSMRLGNEGRALTMLAKEVSDLSGVTHRYLDQVSAIIGVVVSLVGEREGGRGIAAAGVESDAGEADLGRLEEEIRTFVRLTTDACQSARGLLGDAHNIESGLATVETLALQVDETLSILGAATAGVASEAGAAALQEWEQAEVHADRYTMDAERRIHRQLLAMAEGAEASASGPPPSLRQVPENVASGLGDNVDLF